MMVACLQYLWCRVSCLLTSAEYTSEDQQLGLSVQISMFYANVKKLVPRLVCHNVCGRILDKYKFSIFTPP